MLVLLCLNDHDIAVLAAVPLPILLHFLLALKPLLIQVNLERFLKVALLFKLIEPVLFFEFILVTHDGAPLVEDLFLWLYRQVSSLYWQGHGLLSHFMCRGRVEERIASGVLGDRALVV